MATDYYKHADAKLKEDEKRINEQAQKEKDDLTANRNQNVEQATRTTDEQKKETEDSYLDIVHSADLQKDEEGRPQLPFSDADISISHSSDICAAAVLTERHTSKEVTLAVPLSGTRVGIDIELVPASPDLERCKRVANRFLKADIADAFEFYRLWTRKEAYGKMVGDGFFSEEGVDCQFSTYTIKTDNNTYILSIAVK